MKAFALFLILISITHRGMSNEGLEDYLTQTQDLYTTSAGSDDPFFSTIATSMLGWGVGLAIAIGVLTAIIPSHQTAEPAH